LFVVSRIVGMVAAGVACAGLVVSVAGCGAGSVVDPVAQAATTSTGSAGYRMTFSMTIGSSALPSAISSRGSGSFDARDHEGSLSVAADLGGKWQIASVLGASTLRLQERIAGPVVYLELPPALADKLPGAKPWIEVNLAKAAAAAGVPGLSSLAQNPMYSDPSQMLEYLRGASGKLTDLGNEAVDGFQTTHYRAQIDLDRVPNLVPASARSAARKSIAALEGLTNLHQLPVDVWVDRKQLVRREQLSVSVSTGGQQLRMRMTADIPQYGPQPAPALPAASQVTDLSAP
jgi:hypothetical protein